MRNARRPTVAAVLFSAAAIASGCRDSAPAGGAPAAHGSEPTELADAAEPDALASAHHEAFLRAAQASRAVLALEDPIAGARVTDQPPRLGRWAIGDPEMMAFDEALTAALTELDGVSEGRLAPDAQVGARVLRFALDRARDRRQRHPLFDTDPAHAVDWASDILTAIAERASVAPCPTCIHDVQILGEDLEHAARSIIAASPASVHWAQRSSIALRDTAHRLVAALAGLDATDDGPPPAEALAAATRGFDAAATEFETRAAAVPTAAPATAAWEKVDAPRAHAAGLVLPSELPVAFVLRRLAIEDGLELDPKPAIGRIEAELARLAAMEQSFAARERPAATAAPLTAARCRAAADLLARSNIAQGATATAEAAQGLRAIDCARWTAIYAALLGDAVGDAALERGLLDHAVSRAARAASLTAQDPLFAAVRSAGAERAQRAFEDIALAVGWERWAAFDDAVARARHLLCAAGVALRIHTQTGLQQTHAAWVAAHCPGLTHDDLVAFALGDPRGALSGLSYAALGTEPATWAARQQLWWMPHRLMLIVSDPARAGLAPPPERPVTLEPVDIPPP